MTTPNGAVRFYSGLDGSLLTTLSGGSNTAFGSGLATLGDLTGDGQPEIAIGEPDDDTNATDAGNVRIKNPRPRELNGASELEAWADYSVSGCTVEVRRGLVGAAAGRRWRGDDTLDQDVRARAQDRRGRAWRHRQRL